VGLEESRVVRTSVPLGDCTGDYRLGSGYLIADGLVLTAAHVLAPADGTAVTDGHSAEVAGPGGGWERASVAWADAARDVAVLACPALRAQGGVRWGRLAGPDPLDWGAVGFPAASASAPRDGRRQAEHAFGRTSPISERAAGALALTVESRDPTRHPGGSPWAGLSGAAVFCGEHLTGVITADTGGYDKSLTARRTEDFCHDPALAAVLGSPPVLEQVPGRPREPGLVDLRSMLRPRNASFTGRDADLAVLAAEPTGQVVLTQSLTGLGGVGKSALALEYAHRRYDAGEADLAWWFTAEDRPVLLAAMAGLYDRLTGAPGDQDAEAGAIALRNWLERAPYRWIVVFDNAEPGTLDGIVPADGAGQVIITSRAGDWPGTTARTIGALPADEAAALLARITGLSASQGALDLADELGGLALAIEQAAAYIRQTRGTYADYLQALRTDPRAVYETDLARAESVTARVWQRSLNHVTGKIRGHPAATVLGVLSYLAPDDIPRQLLTPDIIKDAPVLGDLTPVQVNVALASLADYSLITLDTDAIAVHRVIQHLTRLDAEARDMAIPYCTAAITLLNASL
jgi:Trypsin-like peptidase domain